MQRSLVQELEHIAASELSTLLPRLQAMVPELVRRALDQLREQAKSQAKSAVFTTVPVTNVTPQHMCKLVRMVKALCPVDVLVRIESDCRLKFSPRIIYLPDEDGVAGTKMYDYPWWRRGRQNGVMVHNLAHLKSIGIADESFEVFEGLLDIFGCGEDGIISVFPGHVSPHLAADVLDRVLMWGLWNVSDALALGHIGWGKMMTFLARDVIEVKSLRSAEAAYSDLFPSS